MQITILKVLLDGRIYRIRKYVIVVRVRNNFHDFFLVRCFDFVFAFNIEEDCVGVPNLALVCLTRW